MLQYALFQEREREVFFETAVFNSHMQKCSKQLQLTQIPYTSLLDSVFLNKHTLGSAVQPTYDVTASTRRAGETPPSDFLSIPSRKGGGREAEKLGTRKDCLPAEGRYHMATDCARVQRAITNQTFLLRCLKMPFKLLQYWASFRRKILSG